MIPICFINSNFHVGFRPLSLTKTLPQICVINSLDKVFIEFLLCVQPQEYIVLSLS